MDAKKKIIVSFSAFIFVLMATVIAVVAVLAAHKVSLSSSVNVSYEVVDVIADVEVYAVKVKNSATTISWGTANTKNFAHNHSGNQETIALGDFPLLKDESVVLKFVFNNNSDNDFNATLTKPSGTNVTIYYAASENDLMASRVTDPSVVAVAGGASQTKSYYARIAITDITQGANFNGSFAWSLE